MLRYQWEDAVRFWNSKKREELLSGQKVGRLQLFDITHRKKDGFPMTTEAAEIMMQASTVEQIAQLKAEAASREVEVQRKYEELQLQLKAEAAARETEQSRKHDALQLQL
ncbi:ribosome biogenesis nsa1 [Gossypium arboreum]|uniref:Ribosome biogenesis nsa1 n=1 Tax=Gossypium arboreum TaxID=29729 RepID=A0A0B0N101_GOSAR|nr:ribosome biogenesis nsa1 [Gossypium arboreum]